MKSKKKSNRETHERRETSTSTVNGRTGVRARDRANALIHNIQHTTHNGD